MGKDRISEKKGYETHPSHLKTRFGKAYPQLDGSPQCSRRRQKRPRLPLAPLVIPSWHSMPAGPASSAPARRPAGGHACPCVSALHRGEIPHQPPRGPRSASLGVGPWRSVWGAHAPAEGTAGGRGRRSLGAIRKATIPEDTPSGLALCAGSVGPVADMRIGRIGQSKRSCHAVMTTQGLASSEASSHGRSAAADPHAQAPGRAAAHDGGELPVTQSR
jgi:hypothetical protein